MKRLASAALCLFLALGSVASAAPDKRGSAHFAIKERSRLAVKRKKLIAALKLYAETGNFPWGPGARPLDPKDPHRDDDHLRSHRFRGPNGALCALASLMHGAGAKAIVERIAREKNHFCVGLDSDKEVSAWILQSGLTIEECQDIQRPGFNRRRRPKVQLSEALSKAENIARLRAALKTVIAKLEKNSDRSLTIAVSRLRSSGT